MRLKFILITFCCLASVQLLAQKANTSNTTDATPQAKIDKKEGCVFSTNPEIKEKLPNPMYQPGNSVDGLVLKGDFLRKHPTRIK